MGKNFLKNLSKSLVGKRVIISGGCGDIGRAIANRFLLEGAKVVLTDILPVEQGSKIAKSLHAKNAFYFICDVSDQNSIQSVMKQVAKKLGGLDVGISNAGFGSPNKTVVEMSRQDWNGVIDVNLTGSFLFAKEIASVMMNKTHANGHRRGSIIFTGTWVQDLPWPTCAHYCASKGGQKMMMKVFAQEFACHGITCNAVAPGIVNAGGSRKAYEANPNFLRQIKQAIPMGRMCTVEELVGAFVFLASEDASYITGTTILVDGGASLGHREVID